jgi:hypothetical protein
MALASGFSVTWNGIDGWLFFFAVIAFAIAAFVAVRPGKLFSNFGLFVAIGLLLWVLTNLVRGG